MVALVPEEAIILCGGTKYLNRGVSSFGFRESLKSPGQDFA